MGSNPITPGVVKLGIITLGIVLICALIFGRNVTATAAVPSYGSTTFQAR